MKHFDYKQLTHIYHYVLEIMAHTQLDAFSPPVLKKQIAQRAQKVIDRGEVHALAATIGADLDCDLELTKRMILDDTLIRRCK